MCIFTTIVSFQQMIDAQIPGPPAGTEGLLFVVLDFKIPANVVAAAGGNLADLIASQLRKDGEKKVVRKAAVFSQSELKDPRWTQRLREETGANIIVGGELDQSGKLTVSSAQSDNARELDHKETHVDAIVAAVMGNVYVLTENSTKEVLVKLGDPLEAGDRLRVGRDSSVVILVNGKLIPIKALDGWFTVKASEATPLSKHLAIAQMVTELLLKSKERYIVAVSR
jgi:hypothetical protein